MHVICKFCKNKENVKCKKLISKYTSTSSVTIVLQTTCLTTLQGLPAEKSRFQQTCSVTNESSNILLRTKFMDYSIIVTIQWIACIFHKFALMYYFLRKSFKIFHDFLDAEKNFKEKIKLRIKTTTKSKSLMSRW